MSVTDTLFILRLLCIPLSSLDSAGSYVERLLKIIEENYTEFLVIKKVSFIKKVLLRMNILYL